jgi:cell growth-regulating nucleolar protein
MVFFVCEGCNESLKKNQVDRHAARCKQCYAVTCVDCNQTFPGNEYAQHITCVTEAEKYQKSLYQGKTKNKLSPQDLWAATIQEAATNAHTAPSNIRHFVATLAECGNVPRNKNKFMNFAKNSLKLNSVPVLESIWTFLESFRPVQAPAGPSGETAPATESTAEAPSPALSSPSPSALDADTNKEEIKEKKKKKKNAEREEVSTAPPVREEEQAQPELKAETKEKKKKKNKEAEPLVVAVAVAEAVQEKPAEKKKKKRKADETESAEVSAEAAEAEAEASVSEIEIVKEKKNKKKKSRSE